MKTMKRIIPFTILILAQTEAKSNLEKIQLMKSAQIHMGVLYLKIRQKP